MDKLQAALEISKIGVWGFNEKDDTIFFSKSSKAIIGFEDDDTFGTNRGDWSDRVHPEDRQAYFQDYQDHISGLKPMYINKHRVLCKEGTYKWILDKGKIVNDYKTDGYIRFIGTHTDITEEVKTEKKINNALTIATKQNNRLKNFAHIVTHNLKQYSGNFESLLNFYGEAETDVEKNEIIGFLKEVSMSLNNTINNLNTIVSVNSKKNEHVEKLNVYNSIESTLKILDVLIVENDATIINNVNKKFFIYYNTAYFESIVQNLISNAIKYKHPKRDPIIIIDSEIKEKKLIFTIRDNGIGIDLKKFGNDIFGLYKTFHFNQDAEGVGLYLVKNQIEAFNGEIKVDSVVDVGTVFTITMHNSIKKAQRYS